MRSDTNKKRPSSSPLGEQRVLKRRAEARVRVKLFDPSDSKENTPVVPDSTPEESSVWDSARIPTGWEPTLPLS